MNKKITTLLASAMLATAFSAGAAKVGDQVLLKGGSAYLSVATQTTTAAQFGQVETVSTLSSLDNLNPGYCGNSSNEDFFRKDYLFIRE